MRLSFFISVLVHLLVFCALFFLFRIVPEMRLPPKIYSVKILQPIVGKKQPEETKKPEVEVEKKPVPKPQPKVKKETKKAEEKPAPQKEKEEKPLEVSVEKDGSEQTSVAVDAPRFPYSYYLAAIERKVSQNWFSSSSGPGERFSCTVYFKLSKAGRVSELRIEESSGNAYFDRHALRAIRSSDPFPPLPRAFSDSWLGIHFTFLQKD
ncbi:MAG: TonB family protein [Candidatus Krumholzibacteriota bacterium]|nr:TonB family protein [Candidatus Krumholzibacteriota bacterium]